VFNEISTGAADDIDKATEIARHMVTRFGMSEQLGQMTYESQRPGFLGETPFGVSQREYSEETAREIDCSIRELVDQAFDKATAILTKYRTQLDAGAKQLLEQETMTRDELPSLK
jgi:cell division protease FtsH